MWLIISTRFHKTELLHVMLPGMWLRYCHTIPDNVIHNSFFKEVKKGTWEKSNCIVAVQLCSVQTKNITDVYYINIYLETEFY